MTNNCCSHSQRPSPCSSQNHIHNEHTHEHKEKKIDKAFRIIEKICAVVTGVFAALTEFWLFVPSFVLGALIGVFTHQASMHQHLHAEGSCSVGFIEQTTGIKLPRAIALAAGFAVMVAHIDHHASVFVPIVGVTLGMWAGRGAAPAVNLCFKKITALFSKPTPVAI